MKKQFVALPVTSCLVIAAGFTLGGGAALGQQKDTSIEEITIQAPRLVQHKAVRGIGPTNTELVSLTRRVTYGDLDLALHSDVMELEKRISDTAKEACEQLAKMYPFSAPNTPDCVKEAMASAKAQTDEVIAAAAKQR